MPGFLLSAVLPGSAAREGLIPITTNYLVEHPDGTLDLYYEDGIDKELF